MATTYVVHITAGALALGFGYVALYAPKGAAVHRKSGMLFVYTMLVMCSFGVLMAATRNVAPAINVPAGLITAYLVVTSLATVRPIPGGRWLGSALMALALTVGLVTLTLGFGALVNGGTWDGMPAFPYFLFGITGIAAGVSDARVIRLGVQSGPARLVRHLWRMTFALLIAAMSFFLGQADEFPEAIRIFPLLAMPVLAVLVTMVYWLFRVRLKRRLGGILTARAREAFQGD